MTRTALLIVLGIAVVLGLVFGIYAELDLAISGFMFDRFNPGFANNLTLHVLREGERWLAYLVAAPAFLAVLCKFFLPRLPMFVPGRAALFLIASLIIGPGLTSNVVLKDYWGRYRPYAVKEFNGSYDFTPWWDIQSTCRYNCSFVAGEPSGAFWMVAPASLAPPQWRPLAYAAAIAFGASNGVIRIAGGGHFFSDVVFAGVITFLIIWIMHGLIYRWPRTRTTDAAIERAIAWPMTKLYGLFGGSGKSRIN